LRFDACFSHRWSHFMLRTKTLVQTSKTVAETPAVASGLRAIDPADFKFIGGGAPRGGWLDAGSATTNGVILSEDASTALGVAAPRGGW
jgi:hypothetical protein